MATRNDIIGIAEEDMGIGDLVTYSPKTGKVVKMKTVTVKDCPQCGKSHFGLWPNNKGVAVCPIKNKTIGEPEAEEVVTVVDKKPAQSKKK